MDNKRVGIVLILVAIAAFLISVVFSEGYNSSAGFIESISKMNIILSGSNIVAPQLPVPIPAPVVAPSAQWKDFSTEVEDRLKMIKAERELKEKEEQDKKWAEYEKALSSRIAIPFKFFLAGDITMLFTGIGFLIIPSRRRTY